MTRRKRASAAAPNPRSLKWLHQFETVSYRRGDKTLEHKVEVFGDFYNGTEHVLQCIDAFLDQHTSENLDIAFFLLQDVMKPLEETLEQGVKQIHLSDDMNLLRQQKSTFILKYVVPKIYYHHNFADIKQILCRSITGILILIRELFFVHRRDQNNTSNLVKHFKAKEFLANITLQIWSEVYYKHGIPFVEDQTLPYLRQLAMLDVFDKNWSVAGGWEQSILLLEEHFGSLPRISSDKSLDETSEIIERSRNSLRCQQLRAEYPLAVDYYLEERRDRDLMYQYSPKCSAYMCSEIETSNQPHRLRCYRCYYFHWCSPACRDYSEEVQDVHTSYCKECPGSKVKECRAQMSEYLNILDATVQRTDKVKCHGCGLQKEYSQFMERCSKCKAKYYCSKSCQRWDWYQGNHRLNCKCPP
ncbi:unnamed protein product [Cylindrotheca closterium]|uniref:MYND-type domain-containing protein n=1 Tax=Cylindrotheca closterium TaxID=2856 RepID=A0AAD2CYF1_9STRA|nr:unnamed protein product [Cylindrotheca closterium]